MGLAKKYMEQLESRGFKDIDGSLCLSHIEDHALKETLAAAAEHSECRICSSNGSVVTLDDLMTEVMEAVRFHYEPSSDTGLLWGEEDGWMGPSATDSNEVLADICFGAFAADVDLEVMDILTDSIHLDDWISNRHSSSLEATEWAWEQFVSDVKSESRFVFWATKSLEGFGSPGERSANFLWSLLPYVEDQKLNLVSEVPRGTAFYRGRLVNHAYDKTTSAKKLGPAPADKAAANRMSPDGVPMFYGSSSPETAIREIAAHGTGGYARVGAFRNQRPLTVLDLTALPTLPSIFDKAERRRNGVFRFFTHFADNVTAPIRPDGRPHVEYVPTQVVTEFFRWVPSRKIDGIKLRSAQDGEDTYVLFLTQEHVDDEDPECDQAGNGGQSDFDFGMTEPVPPVLTMNPTDVHTYEVVRRIDAKRI